MDWSAFVSFCECLYLVFGDSSSLCPYFPCYKAKKHLLCEQWPVKRSYSNIKDHCCIRDCRSCNSINGCNIHWYEMLSGCHLGYCWISSRKKNQRRNNCFSLVMCNSRPSPWLHFLFQVAALRMPVQNSSFQEWVSFLNCIQWQNVVSCKTCHHILWQM